MPLSRRQRNRPSAAFTRRPLRIERLEARVALAGDATIGAMMRTTSTVDVRAQPGLASAELPVSSTQYPFYSGAAPSGQLGAVIEGPRTQDARTWWRVDFGPGKYAGWVTEDVLTNTTIPYVRGIDVSHWQNQINWTSVKNFGIQFAFMKATESTDFTDQQFQNNVAGSRNNGLLVGFYHFANIQQTGDIAADARAEAAYFVSVVGPHIRAPGLPPVLDLEGRGLGGQPPNKAAISAWARAWLAEVQRLTGVRPMIYSNSDWAKNYLESDLNQYNLWHARWTRNLDQPPLPSDPGIWAPNWTFWQYTSNSRVPGIAAGTPGVMTDVDGDVFRGTLADLQTWALAAVPDRIPPAVSGVSVNPATIAGGQPVTIRWTATDYVAVDHVALYLYQDGAPVDTRPYVTGGAVTGLLAANAANLPNSGSYAWTIPANLPAGSYQVKVVAWDAAGNSSPDGANLLSNNFAVTLPPLTAVADLTASATATNQVRLTWTDSVIGEDGFYVDRSNDGSQFDQVAVIAAGSMLYEDVRLESSKQYHYRVRAFRSDGAGPESNSASAITPQLTTVNGTEGIDTLFVVRFISRLYIYEEDPTSGAPPTYLSEVSALGPGMTINTFGGDDSVVVSVIGAPDLGPTVAYNAGAGDNALTLIKGAARLDSLASEGGVLNTAVDSEFAHLITHQLNQHGLTLADAARVTLLPGGATSNLTSLSLGAGATLDITDNALVVDYTGASPVADIRANILAGRGGSGLGKVWNGSGITSSTAAQDNAAAPDSRSVGYAENGLLPLAPYIDFRGQPVDATSVLIAFTRTGDANLDGVVNNDDVTVLGANYLPGTAKPAWALGDFEYNGFVNNDDVTLLGAFYNPAPPPAPAPALAPVLGPTAGLSSSAFGVKSLRATAGLSSSAFGVESLGATAGLSSSAFGVKSINATVSGSSTLAPLRDRSHPATRRAATLRVMDDGINRLIETLAQAVAIDRVWQTAHPNEARLNVRQGRAAVTLWPAPE